MAVEIPVVYVIGDLTAKKSYVGSTELPAQRFYQHDWLLKNNKHGNYKLQRAFNDGNELVVIPFPLEDGADPRKLEQALIDEFYDSGNLYNLVRHVESPRKGIKASPETLEKMRQASLGKVHSLETRERLSEIAKQRGMPEEVIRAGNDACRGKPLSDEHREKVGIASKKNFSQCEASQNAFAQQRQKHAERMQTDEGRSDFRRQQRGALGRSVLIENIRYGSIAEAAEALGVNHSTVQVRLRANSPRSKFKEWKFEDEHELVAGSGTSTGTTVSTTTG